MAEGNHTIGSAYLEVEPKLKSDFESELEQQGTKAGGGFGSKFVAKSKALVGAGVVALGNLVSNAIQNAFSHVQQFITDTIQNGMSFDTAMSQVAATMGVTVNDIKNLERFAQDMGASTKYSATQAAEALNYMALAGYKDYEAMQALPTVLNLAAAGNIDLARASDMVTDAQSALGLKFEELNGFVDQLAKTASTTNTSVEQLGDAILTVGGTAKLMAGGTAELNQVLGLLADNGIKGAEGGTALRNIIMALASPTDAAAKELERLGVAVFDADGNMRPLVDIMGDFNDAFDDMTDEQRINAISTIFNARDLKSVNALLDTSTERWDQVGEAIDNAAGSAQKMADTQLDNLGGDVTILQSAMEGLQIELFHGVAPALRVVVQAFTELISFISSNIAPAFQALNEYLFGTETTVDEFDDTIMGTKGIMDDWAGVIADIGAIVSAVMPTIGEIILSVLSAVGDAFAIVSPYIAGLATVAFDIIADVVTSVMPLCEAIVGAALDAISFAFDALHPIAEFVAQLFTTIKNAMTEPIETAKNIIAGIVEAIKHLFNFRIKIPSIPLPHFVISPPGWQLGDLLRGSIPSLDIRWYGKGGEVDGATLVGAGEKGKEFLWPGYNPWLDKYADAIANKMENNGGDTFIFDITADSETTLQSLVAEAQRARIAYGRA